MADQPASDLAYLDDAVARRLATKALYDALNLSPLEGDYYALEYAPADGGPPTRIMLDVSAALTALTTTISRLEEMLDANQVLFDI